MKRILTLTVSLFFLLSTSAFSYSFLENWIFDPDGVGGVDSVTVPNFFNFVGETTAINTYTSDTEFTFTEIANFTVEGYGLPNSNFPASYYNIVDNTLESRLTAIFVGDGSGTTPGNLNFENGTLDVYFDTDIIGSFNLISGYADIGAAAVPNGDITTIFEATTLNADVWFDSFGKDLSTIPNQDWLLGFATTNASLVSSTFDETGFIQTLELGNNGQFRLAVVPEPSTLILLGGGLVGLGFYARRKKK